MGYRSEVGDEITSSVSRLPIHRDVGKGRREGGEVGGLEGNRQRGLVISAIRRVRSQ